MLIEDENFLNSLEIQNIKKIIPEIDFYWTKITTTKKFPMYSHLLVERPIWDYSFNEESKFEIKSPFFTLFFNLAEKFCKKHNIQYSNVIRACINSTFHIPGYYHWDPHIDFTKEHYVLIMYLSEFFKDSSTIVFKKCQNFDNKNTVFDVDDLDHQFDILYKVSPKIGKAVLFDGKHYHSNINPFPGENRIVCVFNLLK